MTQADAENLPEVRICYLRNAETLYGAQGLCYATAGSVGMDLRACPELDLPSLSVPPGGRIAIPTGVAVQPMLSDMAGFVYSRSGLGAVQGLTVAQGVGVIDPDYRGEIVVVLLNTSGEPRLVQRGDRIAQLVFQPIFRARLQPVPALEATERGVGGFGHTGK